MSKIDIYQDKKSEWRWRRKSSNGKNIGASSESYKSRKACEANANRNSIKDEWEFYQDKKNEFRWRRKSKNGRIVGASCEGFKNNESCQNNADLNGWKGPRFTVSIGRK